MATTKILHPSAAPISIALFVFAARRLFPRWFSPRLLGGNLASRLPLLTPVLVFPYHRRAGGGELSRKRAFVITSLFTEFSAYEFPHHIWELEKGMI